VEPTYDGRPVSYWAAQMPGRNAIEALSTMAGQSRDAADALVRALAHPDIDWRAALNAYCSPPSDCRLIPSILDMLPTFDLNDGQTYPFVQRVFRAAGRLDKADLRRLAAGLKWTDPTDRSRIAELLGIAGRDSVTAAELLRPHLDDPSAVVQVAAAYSLWEVTQTVEPSFSTLLAVARRDAELRRTALRSLSIIGEQSQDGAARLGQLMTTDANADVRRLLCDFVGVDGPHAVRLLPVLEKIAEADPVPEVRAAAGEAIQNIRSELRRGKPD
jgi:HEAT repeat protein